MARVIEENEVLAPHREIHPWDLWLNGQWWELTRGEDFDTTANAIKAGAFYAAQRRGIKATVRVSSNRKIVQVKGIR